MTVLRRNSNHRLRLGDDPPRAGDDLVRPLLVHERQARSLRLEMFNSDVINDSSWPLLQELFAAHLDDRGMRTTDLCASSCLPLTTTLRYLDHLVKCGLVRREDDPTDQRVTLVFLTGPAALSLRQYYSRLIWSERQPPQSGQDIFSLRAKLIEFFGSG